MFYARDGSEITLEQWSKLIGNLGYKRVGYTEFSSGRWVSTVWLGMDHSFGLGGKEPLIFETMVFAEPRNYSSEFMERYSTEEQAREGHERIVNMVRELEALDGREEGELDCRPGAARGNGAEDQERSADHN